jgi:BON domain
MKRPGFLIIVSVALFGSAVQAVDPVEQGHFDDPFMQITNGIAACPVQERAKLTPEEIRAEAHWRSERGTSCYRAGRCRYPNAYLYDQELATRVEKSILADGRFANTSLWMEGYRRWIVLKGCVSSQEQLQEAERVVRNIDDVEAVINELVVLP